MSIWNAPIDLDAVNADLQGTLCEHLGIRITGIGDDFLKASMPVDHRTCQFMGILHGGASVSLAETVGSLASSFCCKPGYYCVGLDINANHLRAGRPPHVTATARPLHLGASTMVWDIRIHDARDKLVCVSRLTMAVLKGDPLQHRTDRESPA
ncbi:MAG: hotdog fold thioesterase [Pseudomonadales bacterium]|nr:hotdog fold thioesterase [Pseudomonadales bacterium]